MAYVDAVNALSPLAYWRFGETDSGTTSLTDSFTGTNGDAPTPTYWTVNADPGDAEIQSNQLRLVGNVTTNPEVRSKFAVSGDYDIQIEYDVTGYTGSTEAAYAQLGVNIGGAVIYINYFAQSTTNRFQAFSNVSGGSFDTSSGDLLIETGKLRIARTGSTVKVYYDNAGWVELVSNATSTADVDYVFIALGEFGSNPALTCFFDNFSATAGSILFSLAADETGNYDGTYENSPTLGVTGLLSDGSGNTAVDFVAASSQYVSTPFIPPADATMSVACLVNIDTLASTQVFFGDIASSGNNATGRLMLGITSTGKWYVSIGNGSGSWYDDTTTDHGLSIDTTYHIVLAVNGTAIKIYVNGTLDSSFTSSVALGTAGTNTFSIGRFGEYAGLYVDGTIDEVAVFPSELNLTQVQSLYDNTTVENPIGVVAVQGSQIAEAAASKTGSSTNNATAIAVQGGQTAIVAADNVRPDNYAIAVQGSQRATTDASIEGEPVKYYFATAGFTTNTRSVPANQEIPPTLKNPGNFKREINIQDFGIVKPTFGEITLSNLDGIHDDLLTKGIEGRKATLYYGPKGGVFPDEFVKVLVSTVGGVSYDYDKIRIKMRDDLEFLDRPILRKTFTGSGGVNGDASVAGTARPRSFGYCGPIPPTLIDSQKLIYHVTENYIAEYGSSIDYNNWDSGSVYVAMDGGVVITRGANYSTVYELENVEPDQGTVRFYVAEGDPVYMRLGSSPVYDVRVTTPDLFATQTNKYSDQVLNEMNGVTATGRIVLRGHFINDSAYTYADFITDQSKALLWSAWSKIDGTIRCEILDWSLAASSVYEFNEENLSALTFEKPLPVYKTTVNYMSAFPANYAGGAAEEVKQTLSKSGYYNSYEYTDTSIISSNKLARETVLNAAIDLSGVGVQNVIDRYMTILGDVTLATVSLRSNFDTDILAIDLNDVVTLTLPRFGLYAGKKFLVIGVRHDYAQKLISFTLWG